jgi:hypothetical protein|tara:strand:- start:928 stop:1509 length:582 start_codon:yes stop_codon:yes gene_type:complete
MNKLENQNALMKEYKKARSKNRRLWKKAFDSNNHKEVTRLLDECVKLDKDYNEKFNTLDKENEKGIAFNATMNVEMIFSFDNQEQQMWNTQMKFIPLDMKESEWIKSLIERAFHKDIHLTKDLYKISMCIGCDKKGYENIDMIKSFLSRNGKYYFQPNQRDNVESAIIKDTIIASNTKPFDIPKKLKSHIKLN